MDGDGPEAAFAAIDDELADLAASIDRCRKAILVSRAAVAAGALALAAAPIVAALRAPLVAIAAVTAMIGGTVWAGASKTSGEELEARRVAAEMRKAALFDEVARRNGWRR